MWMGAGIGGWLNLGLGPRTPTKGRKRGTAGWKFAWAIHVRSGADLVRRGGQGEDVAVLRIRKGTRRMCRFVPPGLLIEVGLRLLCVAPPVTIRKVVLT